MLGERPPGHAGHDRMLLLAKDRVMVELDDAEIRVALQDLGRAVDRAIVSGDDQVGTLGNVVLDERRDDVGFVADHQRDHEPHAVLPGS